MSQKNWNKVNLKSRLNAIVQNKSNFKALSLQQRIKQCRVQRTPFLNLSGMNLSLLPEEIKDLDWLQALDLSVNDFSVIPKVIYGLPNLIILNLSENKIEVVPDEIAKLVNLRRLFLHKNQIGALPPSIGELVKLEMFVASANNIEFLPKELGKLEKLEVLLLLRNKLKELPPEIGNLKSLTELYLSSNSILSLPYEINDLELLEILTLHGNERLMIPESILGPEFIDPKFEDSKSRPKDILNFYFSRIQDEYKGKLKPVNEVKVMLVGRGGAGKTSLRRFFKGQEHNKDESETPGIALDNVTLTCFYGESKVRLWDFAGQEITHALHQFFLTEGCVYIVVLDPRSNTEMQDAEYWLRLLKRYAAESPILIALNRQDARQGGYDIDRRRLKDLYPSIHSFTETNCDTRVGCSHLQENLCDAIRSLNSTEPPHLQVPQSWLNIMNTCDNSQDELQHITLEQFRVICSSNGLDDLAKQESLARLLHKLGVVLHFVDEPRLRETTVLNPHWVTDGVYRLLRFKDKPNSDGLITLSEAMEALPRENEEGIRFFLRLMERFEMCFPLDECDNDLLPSKWLIPGALSEFQPENFISDEWLQPGSVRLRYVYNQLPEGVLPRFIVMTHSLSESGLCWRNGVVLKNSSAMVLVCRGEKRDHIEITAYGSQADRLQALEIVQGSFDRIHSDLPGVKPILELEVAGFPGEFRNIADIEAAESAKIAFPISGGLGRHSVEPTVLLNQTSEIQARNQDRRPLVTHLIYDISDKKNYNVFQTNLYAMGSKKYINKFGTVTIESNVDWYEVINDRLLKSDVIVGFLSTAFLASGIINRLNVTAARAKLKNQGRSILFVLVLLDDISLGGVDLSEYVILRPKGKAISQFRDKKIAFNAVQTELEKLLGVFQNEYKHQTSEVKDLFNINSRADLESGMVTNVFNNSVIYHGGVKMSYAGGVHVGGSVLNSQVGLSLVNCKNMIEKSSPGDLKNTLELLQEQVAKLIEALPPERQDDKSELIENLEMVVSQATSEKMNRRWYTASAAGILEAAEWVKDVGAAIPETIKSLGDLLSITS